MTSPPQLLNVRQTAACLGVCTKTVRRLYEAGRLPIVRTGRAVRIPETAVSTFIAKGGSRATGKAVN